MWDTASFSHAGASVGMATGVEAGRCGLISGMGCVMGNLGTVTLDGRGLGRGQQGVSTIDGRGEAEGDVPGVEESGGGVAASSKV
jgi:hypothetical protein